MTCPFVSHPKCHPQRSHSHLTCHVRTHVPISSFVKALSHAMWERICTLSSSIIVTKLWEKWLAPVVLSKAFSRATWEHISQCFVTSEAFNAPGENTLLNVLFCQTSHMCHVRMDLPSFVFNRAYKPCSQPLQQAVVLWCGCVGGILGAPSAVLCTMCWKEKKRKNGNVLNWQAWTPHLHFSMPLIVECQIF